MKYTCPSCSSAIRPGQKFCERCGLPNGVSSRAVPAYESPLNPIESPLALAASPFYMPGFPASAWEYGLSPRIVAGAAMALAGMCAILWAF